jgi:hypothetical protein
MANHAWCHDIARDEQVRAAEDGRTARLPTLEECIETAFSAGVRDSFRKVEEAWAMIPKSVSASSPVDQENKGDGMSGSTRFPASEQPAPAAFADAAERSVPVSKTGDGQSGLRTERVTLEVTHNAALSAREWHMWRTIFDPRYGESVRVVEEPHFDDLAQVAMQRDAAIREREKAVAFWQGELRARTAERDAARARVAELQAASGGGEGEVDAWGIVRDGNVESVTHRRFRGEAECCAARLVGTVVPLYRAPPQPRGWLTGEEREAVQWAADAAYDKQHPAEDTLRNLLARSTPPEVVLPNVYDHIGLRPVYLRADVIEALAAAGVEVKEVGK